MRCVAGRALKAGHVIMRQTRHTRRTLAGLFCLGALLGLAACGSSARASQAATQPVKQFTPSGPISSARCDGKQPKEAYLFPTLANVPFPALVEGVAHTTSYTRRSQRRAVGRLRRRAHGDRTARLL